MESSLVSARIPHAKKDIGVELLESMGATTTELINSAFDYLIETRQLPSVETYAQRDNQAFANFVASGTFEIDWGPEADSLDYKQMIRQGKQADYESLA